MNLLLLTGLDAYSQINLKEIVTKNEKALTNFRMENSRLKAQLRKDQACQEAQRALDKLPEDAEIEVRLQAKKDIYILCKD